MNAASVVSRAQNTLRQQAVLTIELLAIQYVLGMVTNLFVPFPQTDQADQLWAFARTQLPLVAHMVVGVLLLASAAIFVIRAAGANTRRWLVSAVVGMLAIIVAFYGGVAYTSLQADTYSLVMALGFIGAFLAYGWGLYAASLHK